MEPRIAQITPQATKLPMLYAVYVFHAGWGYPTTRWIQPKKSTAGWRASMGPSSGLRKTDITMLYTCRSATSSPGGRTTSQDQPSPGQETEVSGQGLVFGPPTSERNSHQQLVSLNDLGSG